MLVLIVLGHVAWIVVAAWLGFLVFGIGQFLTMDSGELSIRIAFAAVGIFVFVGLILTLLLLDGVL